MDRRLIGLLLVVLALADLWETRQRNVRAVQHVHRDAKLSADAAALIGAQVAQSMRTGYLRH